MIIFRQATAQDAQAIKDMARRVIHTNFTPFLGTEATEAFLGSGSSDKEIDEGLGRCTLLICQGEILGFAITNQDLLHLIMIDLPAQGKGHGSALLAHTEEKLFVMFPKIRLQTFEQNTATLQFYLKNGWIITAQEQVPGLGQTMLHLEKARPPKHPED